VIQRRESVLLCGVLGGTEESIDVIHRFVDLKYVGGYFLNNSVACIA
jgi:hypothetical protein